VTAPPARTPSAGNRAHREIEAWNWEVSGHPEQFGRFRFHEASATLLAQAVLSSPLAGFVRHRALHQDGREQDGYIDARQYRLLEHHWRAGNPFSYRTGDVFQYVRAEDGELTFINGYTDMEAQQVEAQTLLLRNILSEPGLQLTEWRVIGDYGTLVHAEGTTADELLAYLDRAAPDDDEPYLRWPERLCDAVVNRTPAESGAWQYM
jgi:hypothetical protein